MCFFKCGSIVFERVYVVWAFLHMYIQGFCDVCVCVGIQTVVMVHVSVQCTVYLCVYAWISLMVCVYLMCLSCTFRDYDYVWCMFMHCLYVGMHDCMCTMEWLCVLVYLSYIHVCVLVFINDLYMPIVYVHMHCACVCVFACVSWPCVILSECLVSMCVCPISGPGPHSCSPHTAPRRSLSSCWVPPWGSPPLGPVGRPRPWCLRHPTAMSRSSSPPSAAPRWWSRATASSPAWGRGGGWG